LWIDGNREKRTFASASRYQSSKNGQKGIITYTTSQMFLTLYLKRQQGCGMMRLPLTSGFTTDRWLPALIPQP
jgi:hypothetical protein